MILHYNIEEDSLIGTLEEIEKFQDKMKLFMEKYPYYSYTLDFSKSKDPIAKWLIDLKVERHEQQHT